MSAVRKLAEYYESDAAEFQFGTADEDSNGSADTTVEKLRKPVKLNLKLIPGGKVSRVAGLKSPLRSGSPIAFIVACGTVLVLSLAAVLVLNTAVVNRSYAMARLQSEVQVVSQDVQSKQDQLRRAQAELPRRAAELGMVGIDAVEVINVSKYAAEIANVVTGSTGVRG